MIRYYKLGIYLKKLLRVGRISILKHNTTWSRRQEPYCGRFLQDRLSRAPHKRPVGFIYSQSNISKTDRGY